VIADLIEHWSAWIVVVVAGFGALGVITRKVRKGVKAALEAKAWIDNVNRVVSTELTTNGGSSMKDGVNRAVLLAEQASERADDAATRADTAAEQTTKASQLITEQIAAGERTSHDIARVDARVEEVDRKVELLRLAVSERVEALRLIRDFDE
jgi:hypothetical protein